MNKERLEEIRNRIIVEEHHFNYLNSEKGYKENVYTLLEQDIQYLFEQAEQLENLKDAFDDLDSDYIDLVKQNKRYRKAIKEALEEEEQNLEGYESNVYKILLQVMEESE